MSKRKNYDNRPLHLLNAALLIIMGMVLYHSIMFVTGNPNAIINQDIYLNNIIYTIINLPLFIITFSLQLCHVGKIFTKEKFYKNIKSFIFLMVVCFMLQWIYISLILSLIIPNIIIAIYVIKNKDFSVKKSIFYTLIYGVLFIIIQGILILIYSNISTTNFNTDFYTLTYFQQTLLMCKIIIIQLIFWLRQGVKNGISIFTKWLFASTLEGRAECGSIHIPFESSEENEEFNEVIKEIETFPFFKRLLIFKIFTSLIIGQSIFVFWVTNLVTSTSFSIFLIGSFLIFSGILQYRLHSSSFLLCTLISSGIFMSFGLWFTYTILQYLPFLAIIVSLITLIISYRLLLQNNKSRKIERTFEILKNFQTDGGYFHVGNFLEVARAKLSEEEIKILGLDTIAYEWYRHQGKPD